MKVYVAMAYREDNPACLGVFSSKKNAMKSIEKDYEIHWSDYAKKSGMDLNYIMKAGNYSILAGTIDGKLEDI